ncbi:hypothetical protein GLYMA_05G176800v4 [Glycine max]|uniref:Uncharacterized protein n=2 Tax=Glycine subgen. Soja TaxID=1462606 RepID=A0A0R0K3C6_SOYBN|nr:hypothetical protein JHK87_013187 [Glycine soja]KAH1134958.1 hypothetical protein GYH30_012998 [Glycine max]KRH59307.1 hypothetical protein GLYMA_05G176800v4 [Glycine max]RZC12945.1 hypothetical protein D0Y65_012607 [Glycine soja]
MPVQYCNAWTTNESIASYCSRPSPQKINLLSCEPMTHISDIKRIRTDTTFDLSQKAEKGWSQKYDKCEVGAS